MPNWVSKILNFLSFCKCKIRCLMHCKYCESDCIGERLPTPMNTPPPTPPPSPDPSLGVRLRRVKFNVPIQTIICV